MRSSSTSESQLPYAVYQNSTSESHPSYSYQKKISLIGMVVFAILLTLAALAPLHFNVATIGFRTACIVGAAVSLIGLLISAGFFCGKENKKIPTINPTTDNKTSDGVTPNTPIESGSKNDPSNKNSGTSPNSPNGNTNQGVGLPPSNSDANKIPKPKGEKNITNGTEDNSDQKLLEGNTDQKPLSATASTFSDDEDLYASDSDSDEDLYANDDLSDCAGSKAPKLDDNTKPSNNGYPSLIGSCITSFRSYVNTYRTYSYKEKLNKNLDLPKQLKSPFSLKLWGIALQHNIKDAVDVGDLCPTLSFLYYRIQELPVRINVINTDAIILLIDQISGELKGQPELFKAYLAEINVDPLIKQKNLSYFCTEIDALILALEERKKILNAIKNRNNTIGEQERDQLGPLFGETLFEPLKKAMYAIEYNLGITYAFSQYIHKLLINITRGEERYELQKQAEICRNYISARNPSFNINHFGQKNELDMFTLLFRYLFNGHELKNPLDGLAAIPKVRFIKVSHLTDKKVRADGAIEGMFDGKKWVLLSFGSGSSQYGGHYTNIIYNKNSYINVNNAYPKADSIGSEDFLRSLGQVSSGFDKDPILQLLHDKEYLDLTPEEQQKLLELLKKEDLGKNYVGQQKVLVELLNKQEALTLNEISQLNKLINEEAGWRIANKVNRDIRENDDDRGCVILEADAFSKHKDHLILPTTSPAYTRNNCYFATALVRLAAFHQAALLFKSVNPIPPK